MSNLFLRDHHLRGILMPVSKDNVDFIIRNVKLEDAEALFDIESSVISEGEYFVVVSEELKKTPLQERREQI